jgi:hypothetical protein
MPALTQLMIETFLAPHPIAFASCLLYVCLSEVSRYPLWLTDGLSDILKDVNRARLGGPSLTGILLCPNTEQTSTQVVGVFDPKCDDEPRVYPSQSWFRSVPAINEARLSEFCDTMAGLMLPQKDFTVIFDGKAGQCVLLCALSAASLRHPLCI